AVGVRTVEEHETSASVLYFSIRADRLRLRLQLHGLPAPMEPSFEATFISETEHRPLFIGPAVLSTDNEYRIDAELPEELARTWEVLKVTDRMPFRLILRTT